MTGMQNLKTPHTPVPSLQAVREVRPMRLVGLRKPIEGLPTKVIPGFWKMFSPYLGWIPGQIDKTSYGALLESREGLDHFDYLTAVEVTHFDKIGPDWDKFEVPQQRYAIFPHRGHVSELRQTLHSIFAHSLPALNLSPRRRAENTPLLLERYDGTFDLSTGWGNIEVWVPLER